MIDLRKIVVSLEEVHHEGGPPSAPPLKKAFVAAVLANPFAGRYEPDILPMMEALKPLGLDLAGRLIAALGGEPGLVEGYGKGAIVGADGELEHGALWHVPGGYAMRELLGDAKAIVPSTKKVGPAGTVLDVPITHINASYVRSHFETLQARVAGAPQADEIVYVLAMTTGARAHARVGGLAADQIKGEDGLR
jgi:hypothetical protein